MEKIEKSQLNYYAKRAPEYEKIYEKPHYQPDLAQMRGKFQSIFKNKKVLEIACGPGIWTQPIAETAYSVLATDVNEPMLHLARQKDFPRENVVFENADMFDLQVRGTFDALFGGFIWSHVPLEKLGSWLDGLHPLLEPGSLVVFTDSIFVPENNTPIFKIDEHGNQIQQRKLADGSEHLVLKNFPELPDFERILKGRGKNLRVTWLEYFWVLEYSLPGK